MTAKIFAAITFAFLLGVTLAGCADQFSALRTQIIEQTKQLDHKPSDTWKNAADRGGE